MGADMRRREFITFVGGTFAAWPLRVVAQPTTKRPLIAWLAGISQVAAAGNTEDFLEGIKEFGKTETENLELTYGLADGFMGRLPNLAEDLFKLNPNVIVEAQRPTALGLRNLRKRFQLVFQRWVIR